MDVLYLKNVQAVEELATKAKSDNPQRRGLVNLAKEVPSKMPKIAKALTVRILGITPKRENLDVPTKIMEAHAENLGSSQQKLKSTSGRNIFRPLFFYIE